MDDSIFDQLDQLERGARDVGSQAEAYHNNSSTGYSAYEGHDRFARYGDGAYLQQDDHGRQYGQLQGDYLEEPPQLDSFDEQLLRQPDYGQTHVRALPLARARQPHHPTPQTSLTQRPVGLSQYAFGSRYTGPSSSSPQPAARNSSPSYNASQRHPPPFGHDSRNTGPHRGLQVGGDLYSPHESQSIGEPESEDLPEVPTRRTQPRQHDHFSNAVATSNGNPIVQGINLVSTRDLPDRFRSIFPFPLFNAVQSKCFGVMYKTNDNFVVSAPTGSGKTAILELAICRLVHGFSSGSFKVVYQAPTKSLCSERQRDWQAKFAHLDLQCAELTGDTSQAELRNVQHANIIITTPEKWDSMTRKWKDHQKLMQMVKLFLIDEVHILKEDRGATLEAVVSRMKSVGSDVRFVALSASVLNSQDVATWLGKDPMNPQVPAPWERFGEEFRPVRLQKHVCGYQGPGNDFAFDTVLNGKITDLIAKWSQRKPLMVFCFTRKSCVETAKLLATWWSSKGPKDRYWSAPRKPVVVGDKDLRETIPAGVAFHHAGLAINDRTAVEKSYLEGEVNVICCTSTLAVGVNLPCHMVIIKNTVSYQSTGVKEYSDLEIMQMLGRAGRPQFDNSAVAVIMTRLHRTHFYEQMISGQELLESCLHLNLIDHLNAEIGLGTVTSVASAKNWLRGTFLYVRLKENPDHYKITGDAQGRNLDETLENICQKGITLLEQHDLIRGSSKLLCTEFGDAMARYYLQFETMKNFLALPPKAKISEILSAISQAGEFNDVRFRVGEKPVYKDLNKNSSIKFPIPVNIEGSAHKVSLIIQAVLATVDIPTEEEKHRHEFTTCKMIIFQHVQRLVRCIIDCQLYLEDSIAARNALMLARSFGGQVWDDSPLHIKQLEAVGPVAVRKLVAAGIRSIEDLEATEPSRIETVISRNPPFGTEVQRRASAFPRLRLSLKAIGDPIFKKGECVTIKMKAEIGLINDSIPQAFNRKQIYVCFLADTSDGHKIHFIRISAKKLNKGQDVLFSADLTSAAQTVRGFVMCDEIAGTQRSVTLKPDVPAFMFPTTQTTEEISRQRNTDSNAPNTSKRRATAANQARPVEDVDEFDDAGIDDAALAAVAENDGYINIDDLDGSDDDKKSKPMKPIRTASQHKTEAEDQEPQQLPNGKWACNHKCSDKTSCKHGACCREGLDKKPKKARPKESKKKETALDPKQTQLDLGKTKKSTAQKSTRIETKPETGQVAAASSSTAIGKKGSSSREANDLNRVHNSVKSSVKQLPLLKNLPIPRHDEKRPMKSLDRFNFMGNTQHPNEDGGSSEYGLDSIETDDIPDTVDQLSFDAKPAYGMTPTRPFSATGESEEMLLDTIDDADDMGQELGNGLLDLSSTAEQYGVEDYFGEALADDVPAKVDEDPFQDDIDLPSPKPKPIFVTGNTSSSIIADRAAPKHSIDLDEDDNPGPFKKARPTSRTPSTQLREEMEHVMTPVEEEAPPAPSIEPQETDESVKEWFYREFGTELFTFTD